MSRLLFALLFVAASLPADQKQLLVLGQKPDGHPPGTVYLGWATATAAGHVRLHLGDEPDDVLPAAVDAAVALLADTAERAVASAR